ncbi:hypothetical protein ANN_19309 [Periplaneta americana]|uniref:Transposase n=1 Tax=Periplaneta americana TaxID=6978 RepID=A0ABQ8S9W6_PERAM|nr:hypothetical protein ANN_19309 [Periplaneta americana]
MSTCATAGQRAGFIILHKVPSLPSKETLRGHSDSSFRGEGYIQCCVGVRLSDMYSNQELAEIHFMYGKADGNAPLARRLYQEGNSPGLGRGRPRSTTPEVQEEILEAVNMTPSISTRRVALQVNVPHTTVWRLLKEYQLYPYHLQRVQALSPADYPARFRFCQWFLQQCGVNPNFPALVLFTDEAQFTRDGITNFHNQHVWAYENPRATVPSHHQMRFSLNMWAGIIGDRLVGPHVLVNRLAGQAYTNFLENTIPHVLEDTPLINREHIHFLHDGAPAHFSRTARRYLDRRFPDRWIDNFIRGLEPYTSSPLPFSPIILSSSSRFYQRPPEAADFLVRPPCPVNKETGCSSINGTSTNDGPVIRKLQRRRKTTVPVSDYESDEIELDTDYDVSGVLFIFTDSESDVEKKTKSVKLMLKSVTRNRALRCKIYFNDLRNYLI